MTHRSDVILIFFDLMNELATDEIFDVMIKLSLSQVSQR